MRAGAPMSTEHTDHPNSDETRRSLLGVVFKHFWFKCFGTTGFTSVFFMAYLFLLKHPAFPVTIVPVTALDRWIGIEPLTLPLYLSLWLYLSLPLMLMTTRRTIVEYGFWVGSLCLVGLTIFYCWPSAVPHSDIDWSHYPGMAFLKGVDAAGNACPSLHVATAVFSCFWLNQQLRSHGLGAGPRAFSLVWCTGIVYSTMATKQHMAVDVIAGIGLALAFAWICNWAMRLRKGIASNRLWIGHGLAEPE